MENNVNISEGLQRALLSAQTLRVKKVHSRIESTIKALPVGTTPAVGVVEKVGKTGIEAWLPIVLLVGGIVLFGATLEYFANRSLEKEMEKKNSET